MNSARKISKTAREQGVRGQELLSAARNLVSALWSQGLWRGGASWARCLSAAMRGRSRSLGRIVLQADTIASPKARDRIALEKPPGSPCAHGVSQTDSGWRLIGRQGRRGHSQGLE